jgi:iron(III) transport system permease protein
MAHVSLPFPARRWRLDGHILLCSLVLLIVAVLVLYPVGLIVVNGFLVSRLGQPAAYGLQPWQQVLTDSVMLGAIWNSVQLVLVQQVLSLPLAIVVAWLIARTDMPGGRWLEFLFWLAFFLPALPVLLGWILLFDPEFGLMNQLVRALGVPASPFDIYSFWGIVWTHVAGYSLAVKVMLFAPAFRYMDASLEESSLVSGSSLLGTLARIIVPVMAPTIVIVLVMSIIYELQSFEAELILGVPSRFMVFSTQIYSLMRQEPPLFAQGAAEATLMLLLLLPLIGLQRWIGERATYATVKSQYTSQPLVLRRWRYPAFALVLGLALLVTVVPAILLVVGTFMKLFGFFNLAQPWTLDHWGRVLGDPLFVRSLVNTLLLAFGTAAVAVALFSAIGYIAVRTRFVGRRLLDFISWLPSTLPGVILSLGLLLWFLGSPGLRFLYGTVVALILATTVSAMTVGVQMIKSNLLQLGSDLEEAARVEGGTAWDTWRHVVLPLLAPVLVLVGTLSFIVAARNVSSVVLLASSNSRPLSLLQLDFMVEGRYESAAVVGVLITVLTATVALVARSVGQRFGIRT